MLSGPAWSSAVAVSPGAWVPSGWVWVPSRDAFLHQQPQGWLRGKPTRRRGPGCCGEWLRWKPRRSALSPRALSLGWASQPQFLLPDAENISDSGGKWGAGWRRDAFSGGVRVWLWWKWGRVRARGSAPYLLPPPISAGLAPRFGSSFPKISRTADSGAGSVGRRWPWIDNEELIDNLAWFLGWDASRLRDPSPASRPQHPRKAGLPPRPVTSSLPGGRSGGNKAGFVPLPRAGAGCDPARSVRPPGI